LSSLKVVVDMFKIV